MIRLVRLSRGNVLTNTKIIDRCVHIDLVFPFELGPHAAELSRSKIYQLTASRVCLRPDLRLITVSRLDVVEDIDMNVVQHDCSTIASCMPIVEDVAEDNACFGRRHLDGRLDALKAVRPKRVSYWSF